MEVGYHDSFIRHRPQGNFAFYKAYWNLTGNFLTCLKPDLSQGGCERISNMTGNGQHKLEVTKYNFQPSAAH